MASVVEGVTESKEERMDEAGEDELMSRVCNAVTARGSYIRENAESLTMASFRRLLEQDLGIETSALDPHKKQINGLVDQVLSQKNQEADDNAEEKEAPTPAKEEPAAVTDTSPGSDEKLPRKRVLKGRKATKSKIDAEDDSPKKLSKGSTRSKKRTATPESSDKSGAESSQLEDGPAKKTVSNTRRKKKLVVSDESDAEEAETKENDTSESPSKEIDTSCTEKKSVETESPVTDESTKKERIEDTDDETLKQQSIEAKKKSQEKSNKGGASKGPKRKAKEEVSDEEPSSDSADRKKPKKVSKAPEAKPQNQLVEQLKRMIKSCGMSVPPSIYKRVKQVSESNRDKALVKELEAILQKEGLNRHSSEKEVKAVKRKKDKQKDLEGIDLGNIIKERRSRRQQANFYDFPEVPSEKKIKRRKPVAISDDDEDETETEEVGNEEKTVELQEKEATG